MVLSKVSEKSANFSFRRTFGFTEPLRQYHTFEIMQASSVELLDDLCFILNRCKFWIVQKVLVEELKMKRQSYSKPAKLTSFKVSES